MPLAYSTSPNPYDHRASRAPHPKPRNGSNLFQVPVQPKTASRTPRLETFHMKHTKGYPISCPKPLAAKKPKHKRNRNSKFETTSSFPAFHSLRSGYDPPNMPPKRTVVLLHLGTSLDIHHKGQFRLAFLAKPQM